MIAGLVDHYRVVTPLGAGGMGEVYKAIDTRLNRPVAIKAIRDDGALDSHAILRLRAEALAAASLDHPYICRIYELLDIDRATLIVMEFVEGETLSAVLARGVPPLATTLRYGAEIAEGLSDAHNHGLVHRDVKPSNVMITPYGHVKLLDFGVARLMAASGTTTRSALTGPSAVVGTPRYMAPEQALGHPVTPRADLFSLGVVLFECLSGQLPFEAATRDAYMQAMLAGRTRSLDELAPTVPVPVRRLVEQCLQVDPGRRPESAAALGAELHRAAELLSDPAASFSVARRRWGWRVPILAVALAIAGVAGAYRLWRASPPSAGLTAASFAPVVTDASAESDARISPEGRWISFLSDRDGPLKLFVQPAGSSDAKPVQVPGDAIVSHVWSPDGTEFACVVRQAGATVLEIVPAFFGGLPRTSVPLTPTPERVRASRWVGDTVYLDVELGASGHPLWRVKLGDGVVEDLTPGFRSKLDPKNLRSFDVSADGQDVVMAAADPQTDLWVARVDGTDIRRLTNDAAVERNPVWIGTSGRVAFQSNGAGQLDLWELDTQSGNAVQQTASQDEDVPSDATADGSVVLFERSGQRATLWSFDPRTQRSHQMTANALSDFWPSVSRNGLTLAFQRTRATLREGYSFLDTRIFVTAWNGTDAPAPQTAVDDGFGAQLSPDGKYVAYLQRSDKPTRNLLLVRNVPSGETRTLTRAAPMLAVSKMAPVDIAGQQFQWAPSGATLYFVAAEDSKPRIARATMAAGEAAEVVVSERSLGQEEGNPARPATMVRDLRLSPDGTRLAYLTWSANTFVLRVRNLRTGRDELVRNEPGNAAGIFLRGWTGNGRSLLLLRSLPNADGTSRIDLHEIAPDNRSRLAGSIDAAYPATSRLDTTGGRLFVTAVEHGVHNIYVFDLTGRSIRRLTDNEQRWISFSGIEPLANGALIYSRPEWRRDIWEIVRKAR